MNQIRRFPLTKHRAPIGTLAIWAGSVLAAIQSQAAEDSAMEAFKARFEALETGLEVRGVQPSKVPGLYEVAVEGGVIYVTQDARYLIAGSLYEARDGGLVNLTEEKRAVERRRIVAEIDPARTIAFAPDGDTRASVVVFTDTDCGYCRKMHQEMAGYNEKGIEVRYLAFPRSGIGSPTYDKMVSAWCAEDPRGALTALKRGEGIAERYCEDHPVGVQYELGQSLGIEGTPSIVLPDGTMLPGYAPPDQLASLLGL